MKKLKFEHFKQIIKNLDKEKELLSQKETTGSKDKTVNADKPMMSNEKESKILTLLQKFENSELYTDNSISLSYLATYCETNGKYLSYIINTYKKNDFNNYINTLRINYIIRKLKSSPKYRKYKIATLAEESGFSSLS
ncbi:helix-turn-helix domain-containing protein [Chryseobacterium daeguense]|uniref:hypothetical protein n=1 Tax=Chryseobacterium daeguense TaxID=412438 RepID=UPI0004255716|nr:hypothetical protein [Chryseobacterium daeguense]